MQRAGLLLLREALPCAGEGDITYRSRMNVSHIRNFSIIAHTDHGKSTPPDVIRADGHAPPQQMQDQVLDNMDLNGSINYQGTRGVCTTTPKMARNTC